MTGDNSLYTLLLIKEILEIIALYFIRKISNLPFIKDIIKLKQKV